MGKESKKKPLVEERFICRFALGHRMPAKKTVRKADKKTATLNKADGHLWGIADTVYDHADNVARYGTGTLREEGINLKLLAQELRDFLEKTPAQRRKAVAKDLRFYNRWLGSRKV